MVLAGAPGTGKTILAQQICFARATAAHKAVYYTTVSEPHTKLVRHLEPFAFFDPEALGGTVEYIHLGSFLRPGTGARTGWSLWSRRSSGRCWTKSPPSW